MVMANCLILTEVFKTCFANNIYILYHICILFYKISIEIKYILTNLFTFFHCFQKFCLRKTTNSITTYNIFFHTIKCKCKFCSSFLKWIDNSLNISIFPLKYISIPLNTCNWVVSGSNTIFSVPSCIIQFTAAIVNFIGIPALISAKHAAFIVQANI